VDAVEAAVGEAAVEVRFLEMVEELLVGLGVRVAAPFRSVSTGTNPGMGHTRCLQKPRIARIRGSSVTQSRCEPRHPPRVADPDRADAALQDFTLAR